MNDITDLFDNKRIDKVRYDSLLKHFKLLVTEDYEFPQR